MNQFDPYHKWLGIPRDEQPPNHYRLLGITPFESDPDVIEAAADRQMKYVSQCAIGEHLKLSQQLLNELSAARVCLLVPAKKNVYDTDLKKKLAEIQRIEHSMVPVVLAQSESKVAAPEFDFGAPPEPPKSRRKTQSSKGSKASRKQAQMTRTFRQVAAIVVVLLVCVLGLRSMFASRPNNSVSRPDDQTSNVPTTPQQSASIETPEPKEPIPSEPEVPRVAQSDESEMEPKDDQETVKLFGDSFVVTKGDPAGFAIAGSEAFSPSDSFSIEFWVSTTSDRGTLISKRHTGDDPSVLVHLHDGVPNLSIAIGGGEKGSGGGAPPINDGKWHHIAVVKQSTLVCLFVDGNKTVQFDEPTSLESPSPWKYGCSFSRAPGAARFGGIRISKIARYNGPFTPTKKYTKDSDTVLEQ